MIHHAPTLAMLALGTPLALYALANTLRNAWPAIVELVAEVNAAKVNKQWREW